MAMVMWLWASFNVCVTAESEDRVGKRFITHANTYSTNLMTLSKYREEQVILVVSYKFVDG